VLVFSAISGDQFLNWGDALGDGDWLVVLAFSDDHPSVGNGAQGIASVPAEGSHSPIDGTMLRRPKVQAG
jgi:hypothetical protein